MMNSRCRSSRLSAIHEFSRWPPNDTDPMNRSKGKVSPKTSNQSKKQEKKTDRRQSRGRKRISPSTNQMNPRQKQVSVASAYATGQTSGKARFVNTSVDSTRIVHREQVGQVAGTANFTIANEFSVNPGIAASFPWLSTQAVGWEKYRFNSLRMCFYTRSSTSNMGSLLIGADYNALDNAPETSQILSAYHGTQEDAPWKDMCFVFDQKILNTDRFIRNGTVPTGADLKTYDIATLYVATEIASPATTWGKVWFEYDVTLINQQLPAVGTADTLAISGVFTATPGFTGGFGPVVSSPGQTPTYTLTGLVAGQEYYLAFTGTGTGITSTSFSGTSITGKTVLSSFINAAATAFNTSETFIAIFGTVTVSPAITATTITASNMVVCSLVPSPSF
jgi:hypothetical protein